MTTLENARQTNSEWKINPTRNLSSWVIESGGKVVANLPFRNGNKEEALKNAFIVQSAKQLLATLKDNHEILFMLRDLETNLERRQALADQLSINSHLIAKAEGRQ